MGISKYIDFDLFIRCIGLRSSKQIFQHIAHEASFFCETRPQELFDTFIDRYNGYGVSGENGVAIFDVKSKKIKKPIMFVVTFDQEIDLNERDTSGVDLMVGVASPESYGAEHLQNLASIARLFRSHDLCSALRETKSEDEMKMLFMPSQDWIIAA